MKTVEGQDPEVSPTAIFLEDRTRLDWRSQSRSGGYTIDINNMNTRIIKVYVA